MRRSSIWFAMLATAVLAVPVLAADTPVKSPWDGFGEGSWVLTKSTSKTVMTGMEPNESVTEGRQTLKKLTAKAYTVTSEMKSGDQWFPTDLELPRVFDADAVKVAGAKVEDLGNETLTIDGESLVLKKQKTTVNDSVAVSWSHEKHGPVKSESKGGGSENTWELSKWKVVVKVKGNDVECRVHTSVNKSPHAETTSSTWTSDAIPGGLVRVEMSSKMAAMTMTSVTEAVDFEKK